MSSPDVTARLEYLRGEIRAECISWGELAELQGLIEHIDPDDDELLAWASSGEDDDNGIIGEDGAYLPGCSSCGALLGRNPHFVWHNPDEDCRAVREPEHDHVWGPIEHSRLSGNPHRKCQVIGCSDITLDLDDDEQEEE